MPNALAPAIQNRLLDTALPMEGRLTFLPARITPQGKEWAVPGVLASAWNALTAPRRAYIGQLGDPYEEAMNVAGMAMLGAMPASAPKNSLGMNVWHGSPHKFDKFDASKIGTGEGAQAYGHGLYVAESPKVASDYRKQLAGWPKEAKNIVNDVANLGITDDAAREVLSLSASIAKKEFDIDTAAKWLGYRSRELRDLSDAQRREILLRMSQVEVPGSLYKIDLPDEQIAKMLDWDKPLSQQHPDAKTVLQSIFKPSREGRNYATKEFYSEYSTKGNNVVAQLHGDADGMRVTGFGKSLEDAKNDLFSRLTVADIARGYKNPVEFSQAMSNAGIPGIRYLDQGSRTAGQGTSNFVVFPGNESLLTILERNGMPVRK